MKARIPNFEERVVQEAVARVENIRPQIYDDVTVDVISQAFAICLGTLEMSYGFRGKRLKRFADEIMSYSMLMSSDFFMLDCIDIKKHMKEKYGIDTHDMAEKIYGGLQDEKE